MPTICKFKGIIIRMYLAGKEHNPPHIHAYYGKYAATFLIENGELYLGAFPPKKSALVNEFILKYKDELLEMWNSGSYKSLPGLK